MIYAKTSSTLFYLEDADQDLIDEIEKVDGVLMVYQVENKSWVIFKPEANAFEVEIDIRELINEY